MKKLLIVGAGSCQVNAIKKMKSKGYHVIAADYNAWTVGKSLADEAVLADAFDLDAIAETAKAHEIDGIFTVGTDQPVYVVNRVAEALNLPHDLDRYTALWVTNKKEMKQRFSKFKIPTVPYAIVNASFSSTALAGIKPPYVVKPLDSQGQRGIFKLEGIDEIRQNFDKVIAHSRQKEILVESYYESTEVTLSGWVSRGKVSIFTITDRVCFPSDIRLGVCIAHQFPSKHQQQYGDKIVELTHTICQHFNIENGPIYFQFLIGEQGIKVNEIACRLGGAFEDVTIPYACGVDVLDWVISDSFNEAPPMRTYQYLSQDKPFNTQLFFCKPGKIVNMTTLSELLELPFVIDAGYNYRIGDTIEPIKNASQRAGYFIVTGESEAEVASNISSVYDMLQFVSEKGDNLIISYEHALIGNF